MTQIRLFSQKTLHTLTKELSEKQTTRSLAEKCGFTIYTVNQWKIGQKLKCQGQSQDRLYLLFGDKLFTHGLDIKKLRKRLDAEEKLTGAGIAAKKLNVSHPNFKAWQTGLHLPSMIQHQHFYKYYGISVFKRMNTLSRRLKRAVINFARRIRG